MIRVLVIDDSVLVRRVLEKRLSEYPGIEVVGTAVDPYVAREKIAELKPDVLTLDLELPRMDGLTFLEKLMVHHPMPVVVVSSLAPINSAMAMRALSLGAVGVVPKPSDSRSVPESIDQLVAAIKTAKVARIRPLDPKRPPPPGKTPGQKDAPLLSETTEIVVAIGASTGGPQAIETVLSGLPPTFPGIVIAQHMSTGFTAQFAKHLDTNARLEVREARDNDMVTRGRVLIAPAGSHMELRRNGAHYVVRLTDGPPVHFVKPAVDVLFKSVALYAGANSIGVLLTGMGVDGAEGLFEMKERGAMTFAESEDTCVVYGMPQAADKLGAVQSMQRIDAMAAELISAVRTRGSKPKQVATS